MRRQVPTYSSNSAPGYASQACAERLETMFHAADELIAEIGLGGTGGAARLAAGLLAGLGPTLPTIARERSCGRAMARLMLDGMADKVAIAADRHAYWPRCPDGRPPRPEEMQVRALVARLRMVSRN